jgi:hypothetical protein
MKLDYLYLLLLSDATQLKRRGINKMLEYSMIVLLVVVVTAWLLYDFDEDDDDQWGGAV